MRRQRPSEGDLFEVEVGERYVAFGQILELTPQALNSVGVALWEPQEKNGTTTPKQYSVPLAVLLTTPDLLKKGRWRIIKNIPVLVGPTDRPYERFRDKNWVGSKVIGSGIVESLLQASVGLQSWDAWHDPQYLDGLLFPGRPRPLGAIMKSAFQQTIPADGLASRARG